MTSGFLLESNLPSELSRIKPDPRVTRRLEAADDNQLYLSVISIGEICKGVHDPPRAPSAHASEAMA